MAFVLRSCFKSLMFPAPEKPKRPWRSDACNKMLRTIAGDEVHCSLVCPFDDMGAAPRKPEDRLCIFLHGNADDIESCTSYCQWLADSLRMNVLVCDYPGYGFSSGEASQEGLEDAAITVMEYATSKLQFDVSQVFVIGKSIGSYPAISLAAHPAFADSIRGLVLISPVASAARCVFDCKKVPAFVMRRLDAVALANIEHIANVRCPICIVHGLQDDVVSVDNSHALLTMAKADTYYPPLWLQAGHNDIECKFKDLLLSNITDFMVECNQKEPAARVRSPYDDFL